MSVEELFKAKSVLTLRCCDVNPTMKTWWLAEGAGGAGKVRPRSARL